MQQKPAEGIWPPLYSLKKHPRARHVKLKMSIRKGLEIIVPTRFNSKHLPDILEKNRQWIEKKLNELSQLSTPFTLPDILLLRAIDQTWKVIYLKTQTKKITIITRPTQEIVLLGDIENHALCKKALITWLKSQAKKYLPEKLHIQSERIKLTYNKVTIRDQESRWGSCSSDKNINLNYKLLFLPPDLMNYVLIHELCHTVHLDHSPQFWQLLASFDAKWEAHKKALRVANQLQEFH